jgi:ABC-type multidrug transport system fused ATPase/permease subunit
MIETIRNIGWSVVFSVVAGLVGTALVMMASAIIPRLIDRLTPNSDEQREIARGNQAVAEYFGRLVGAAILGVSVVVAAAILGGLIAALH